MYNPYDPFLANSLAQVQAGGLTVPGLHAAAGTPGAAGHDPGQLHSSLAAAQVAAGGLGPAGVRPPNAGFPGANAANLAAAAAAGLPANLSLQAAVANQAAAVYSAGGGLPTP